MVRDIQVLEFTLGVWNGSINQSIHVVHSPGAAPAIGAWGVGVMALMLVGVWNGGVQADGDGVVHYSGKGKGVLRKSAAMALVVVWASVRNAMVTKLVLPTLLISIAAQISSAQFMCPETPQILDTAAVGGVSVAMIDGKPSIAYGPMRLAQFDGAQWTFGDINTFHPSTPASLAEIGGKPAVTYRVANNEDYDGDGVNDQGLWYARRVTGEWSTERVAAAGAGRNSRLVDFSGQPGIFHTEGSQLRFAWWNGIEWADAIVESMGEFSFLSATVWNDQPALA